MQLRKMFALIIAGLFSACTPVLARNAFQLPACPPVNPTTSSNDLQQKQCPKPINLEGSRTEPKCSATEQTGKVNLQPLALVQSEEEQEKQRQVGLDAERRQLTELWAATIARSEDIKFVMSTLQPTSDPKHTASTTMKYVSGALFNILQSAPLVVPGANSMPVRMSAGLGGSVLSSLFGQHLSESTQISREQGCILYTMIRGIAEKLVQHYRDYRGALGEFEMAQADLADLDDLLQQSQSHWTAADHIQFEYTIRRSRREAKACADRAFLHRVQLSDLAGPDAVQRLDEAILCEKQAVESIIAIPDTRLLPVPARSARLRPIAAP